MIDEAVCRDWEAWKGWGFLHGGEGGGVQEEAFTGPRRWGGTQKGEGPTGVHPFSWARGPIQVSGPHMLGQGPGACWTWGMKQPACPTRGQNFYPGRAGRAGRALMLITHLTPLQALCVFPKHCKVEALPLCSGVRALRDSETRSKFPKVTQLIRTELRLTSRACAFLSSRPGAWS